MKNSEILSMSKKEFLTHYKFGVKVFKNGDREYSDQAFIANKGISTKDYLKALNKLGKIISTFNDAEFNLFKSCVIHAKHHMQTNKHNKLYNRILYSEDEYKSRSDSIKNYQDCRFSYNSATKRMSSTNIIINYKMDYYIKNMLLIYGKWYLGGPKVKKFNTNGFIREFIK